MMSVSTLRAIARFLLILLLVGCFHLAAWADQDLSQSVRVMSFNVRYGTADDGDDRWDLRKEIVARVMRESHADLIGTQEMLPFQAEYLNDQLDQYDYVGRSRELDNDQGEQCGIFFRRGRFIELERGSFWLSEHPETPGSRGWDAALPRMATWLKLFDRDAERAIVVINTHFDHRGEQARERSATLVRRYAERFARSYPLILTGDFNAAEDSAPYEALLAERAAGESPLIDTYRQMHPDRLENEGTFNGFRGRQSGPRIDWILASRSWRIVTSDIVRWADKDRYPSDHFPVSAELAY